MRINGNKKLLLVNPGNTYKKGAYRTKDYSNPPLNLATVAALTPPDWEVEIWDENIKPFLFQHADLVGITALSSQANRAYEIASLYRKSNIPTVLGGIHASMIPEEASRYVDVVVKGEAESVWQQVLNDFDNRSLQPFYEGSHLQLINSPAPRFDLYEDEYGLGSIQTTRGCPLKCNFCTVWSINGHKYRFKSVEESVKEFLSLPQDRVYIVDDDFYGYTPKTAKRVKEFCKRVIDSGIKKEWYTFTSLRLSQDDEALRLMSQAGCRLILLGIETEVVDQLMTSKKITNLKIGVENYNQVFDAFHKNGISVLGSFIFGLDTDTPESILRRAEYYINSDIDAIQAGVLTPLPGTEVYYDMVKNNRLVYNNFPKDWERYTFFHTNYKPKNMTHKELDNLMLEVWEKIYDLKTMKRKFLKTLKLTKNPSAAAWAFSTNIKYRNTIFEGIKPDLNFIEEYQKLTSISILNG